MVQYSGPNSPNKYWTTMVLTGNIPSYERNHRSQRGWPREPIARGEAFRKCITLRMGDLESETRWKQHKR